MVKSNLKAQKDNDGGKNTYLHFGICLVFGFLIYLNFVNPVTGRRDLKAESVHAAANELLGTGHRQTRFEMGHVGGNETGKYTLDCHAEMLRF